MISNLTLKRKGKVYNVFSQDPELPWDKMPSNKIFDITNYQGEAWFSSDMVALKPLTEMRILMRGKLKIGKDGQRKRR